MAGGGIEEGDYTSWTHKWSWSVPEGVYYKKIAFYIDEENDILYLWWYANSPQKIRFGAYNITDHSAIFESPTGIDYLYAGPAIVGAGDHTIQLPCHYLPYAVLRSHQTYMLLERDDLEKIEVWRAGSLVWSHDLNIEGGGSYAEACAAEISLTGKYILLYECSDLHKLVLFEGT